MKASLTPIFKSMPREQSKKKLFVTTLQNLSFPMVFRSLQSRPRGDTLRFFFSFKEMPLAVPHASNEPVHRWNMLQAISGIEGFPAATKMRFAGHKELKL